MKTEFEWISEIRKILGRPSRGVQTGIGDDAAVLRTLSPRTVVTVDALVEKIHFDFSYLTSEEVGHKALAVNLSDLAAMGATPKAAVVSVGLPASRATKILPGLYKGIAKVARLYGVDIVGGNLSRTPGMVFVDVTCFGTARIPILRSGARPGDWVGLFGNVGEAALGLQFFRKLGRRSAMQRWPALCRAQATPTPLTEVGKTLGRRGWVNALIDVSDGLMSELNHLALESKVRLEVDLDSVPLSAALRKGCQALARDPLEIALYGGEDYALLFTASEKNARALLALGAVRVGRVEKGKPGVWGNQRGARWELVNRGFDHFRPA